MNKLKKNVFKIYGFLFLFFFIFNINLLYADEATIISEETTPPRLVVDEQKKEIVQRKKKVERENGWDFSLGVLYFQSSEDSGDNKFFGLTYTILPFLGISYKYNA